MSKLTKTNFEEKNKQQDKKKPIRELIDDAVKKQVDELMISVGMLFGDDVNAMRKKLNKLCDDNGIVELISERGNPISEREKLISNGMKEYLDARVLAGKKHFWEKGWKDDRGSGKARSENIYTGDRIIKDLENKIGVKPEHKNKFEMKPEHSV